MTRTVGSLLRMYIEACRQLCHGFLALQREQCHLRLEGWSGFEGIISSCLFQNPLSALS